MPCFLQRKLKVRFIGKSEWKPKAWSGDKYIPVIGFETFPSQANFPGGLSKPTNDINYLCLGDEGRLFSVASHNCHAIVDEQAENEISKITEALINATALVKTLSSWVQINKDAIPE